jgi:hypothetical protein
MTSTLREFCPPSSLAQIRSQQLSRAGSREAHGARPAALTDLQSAAEDTGSVCFLTQNLANRGTSFLRQSNTIAKHFQCVKCYQRGLAKI